MRIRRPSPKVAGELLARNPADAVDPPKTTRAPIQTYDLDQTAELVEAMRSTRMFIPTLLAVLCGLRRGEVCGLRWRNVDLDGGRLAVVESAEQVESRVRYKLPKNGKGRALALSATMVEELRAHRVRQAEELLKVGVRLSDETFVVAQADGSPLQPDSITQDWFQIGKHFPAPHPVSRLTACPCNVPAGERGKSQSRQRATGP